MPKDKVSGTYQGCGFIEFKTEQDADYAVKTMNTVRLFGKPMKVNKSVIGDRKIMDVGANIFIGGLAEEVDEKLLYDTFSAFGGIISNPKIMSDMDTGSFYLYYYIFHVYIYMYICI